MNADEFSTSVSHEPSGSRSEVRPGAVCLGSALLVLGGCTFLLSLALAGLLVAAWNGCAVVGSIILGPAPALLGWWQYFAVFRQNDKYARRAAVLLFIVAGLAFFCLVGYVAECGWEEIVPPSGPSLVMLLLGGGSLAAAIVNLRWERRLKAHAAATRPFLKRAPRVSRLEWGVRAGVLAGFAALTIYFVHTTPPQYAEHVEPSKSPIRLPPHASDVCFCQGQRGAIAVEFTIDERGFCDWVAAGIGSLEARAANVPLQEIDAHTRITRYYFFCRELDGPDEVTVTNGLVYYWRKEDRGVHAVFDRSISRAYYFAHYH